MGHIFNWYFTIYTPLHLVIFTRHPFVQLSPEFLAPMKMSPVDWNQTTKVGYLQQYLNEDSCNSILPSA